MSRHNSVEKCAFCVLSIAAVVLGMLMAFPIYAQVSGGTFSGTVADSSGAVLPGAKVSIKDVSTGVGRTVDSDAAGFYTAPNLLPGTYEVTVTAAGFSTQVRSGIVLTVGAQQILNFTMQLGTVSEKVQVTSEAPDVQLVSSTISTVVNSSDIRELPLNGRDWTQLATLQAGANGVSQLQVGISGDGGNQRSFRGFGNQVSIAGARPQQNNYRLDGISINDYTSGGPGSVSGQALGVDAIQEFSVLTSNYTAEYGKTSGGVINAISRSGTNQFHGSAFEFLRNNALDAANFFDNFNNTPIPAFRRNQFGASGGGPIRKDRTFVFGSYEGFRQALGLSELATVPSADARNGLLHNSDGTTTTVTVDPLVAPFLGFWHLPNGPLFAPGNTGLYSFAAAEATSENFLSTRVDHKISDADSIFGSWQYDKGATTLPDNLNDVLNHISTSRQVIVLEETHIISPRLINSVRGGYNRSAAVAPDASTAINPLSSNTALGTIPGHAAGAIAVSGMGSQFNGGVWGLGFASWYANSYQAYDDAFYTKGKNSFKFGFAYERQECNCYNISAYNMRWKFGSLTNFLTNLPSGVNGQIPGGYAERGWRDSLFGMYFQDDLHLKSNLTINVGLRYEPAQIASEVHGKSASLHNLYTDTTVHTGSPIFSNNTLLDFDPRVGFAWDPFKNGKTSIRGGFGMFDMQPLAYEYQNQEDASAPFELQGSAPKSALALPHPFPTGAYSSISPQGPLRVSYVQQNPSRSYDMTWNLNVQRELVHNLTATVAYVGSRGVHLPFKADDINDVIGTKTSAGYLWPTDPTTSVVLNPAFGRIDSIQWSNSVTYHGLQAEIAEKLAHGFEVGAAYTYSQTIDFGSSSTIGDNYGSSISSPFFWDPSLRRGLADYNIGQNFVLHYVWVVPTPQSLHGPAAWAARGWQVGGILTLQTGLPFTPNLAGAGSGAGGDPLGLNNNDPFDFPDRVSSPGCKSLVNPGNVNNYMKLNCFALPMATSAIASQCVPFTGPSGNGIPGTCSNLLGNLARNSLNGPGIQNLDFSLSKNTYVPRISETFNVQFRAEFFNILNHPNFLAPLDNSNIFDQSGSPIGGAGQIDATSTAAREIQFAIKVNW